MAKGNAKSVRLSKSSGVRYNAELQRIVNAVRKDINKTILPLVRRLQPEYATNDASMIFNDSWVDTIIAAIKAVKAKYSGPIFDAYSELVAANFVKDANRVNRERFNETTKSAFGIDVFGDNPDLVTYLQASVHDNAQLIQTIPMDYLDQVESIVFINIRAGNRSSVIAKQLTKQFGIEQRRAKFIARDQTESITGDLNVKRQKAAGFTYFAWDDSDDQRVRPRHRQIANKVTAYGKGIYRLDNQPLSDEGTPIIPGQDYNCFTGDSKINIFCGAEKLYRHTYTGKLAKFITDNDVVFECTPHHPVLTDRGFKAAKFINIGDNVVYVPDQGFNIVNGDCQSSDVKFSKLFDSFNLTRFANKSIGSTRSDFHGDLSDKDVDIISFDWSLPYKVNTPECKKFFEFMFSQTDEMLVRTLASSDGDLTSVVQGLTFAPKSIVSSYCKILTSLFGGLGHSQEHALRSIRLLYSTLIENTCDDISGAIQLFRDCFNTHISVEHQCYLLQRNFLFVVRYAFGIGDIEIPAFDEIGNNAPVDSKRLPNYTETLTLKSQFNRITDKMFVDFSGHVYNLQMKRGLYISQNLAVSNCRCVARAIADWEVKEFQEAGQVEKGVYR